MASEKGIKPPRKTYKETGEFPANAGEAAGKGDTFRKGGKVKGKKKR